MMKYLPLLLVLCGCPATNSPTNAAAGMTAAQQTAYAEDLDAVLDEAARGFEPVNLSAEGRARYAGYAKDIDGSLRELWVANESSSKTDRRRLMLNKLREHDNEVQKAGDNRAK